MTKLIKGHPAILVRNGQWQRANMRQQDISTEDVLEDMRLNAQVDELEKIRIARLEVSGDISFILTEEKT